MARGRVHGTYYLVEFVARHRSRTVYNGFDRAAARRAYLRERAKGVTVIINILTRPGPPFAEYRGGSPADLGVEAAA